MRRKIVIAGILVAAIALAITVYLEILSRQTGENSISDKTSESSEASIPAQSSSDTEIEESDTDKIFVDLLLLEDRSLAKIEKIYGTDYNVESEPGTKLHKYKNGMTLKILSGTGELESIQIGDEEIRHKPRILYGDVLPESGEEIVALNDNELIIIEKRTKKILKKVITEYVTIEEFTVGSFLNDNIDEVYLQGWTDSKAKRGIYKFIDGNWEENYSTDAFGFHSKHIKASITDHLFDLSFNIEDNKVEAKSVLPDRVFYNNEDQLDKNSLLSIDKSWEIIQQEGKWLVKERYLVNFAMLTYYWGPPDLEAEDNETMYNDLARVDVYYEIKNGKPQFFKLDYKAKYSSEYQEDYPPIMDEEGRIVNGPALGMSLEEAVKSLGGDESIRSEQEYEYEKDGVYVWNGCGGTTDIEVKTPKYQTTRGLKVGYTIDEVERLYGCPDLGMSGDDYVEYKFCYFDEEGNLNINYYRILMIRYEKDRVSSYEFYQVILD